MLKSLSTLFLCSILLALLGCDQLPGGTLDARIKVVNRATGVVILDKVISPIDGTYYASTHLTSRYPAIAATHNGEVKYVKDATFTNSTELSFVALGRDPSGEVKPHTNSSLSNALRGETNVEFTLTYDLVSSSSYKEHELPDGTIVKRPIVETSSGIETVFITSGVMAQPVIVGDKYEIQFSVTDNAKAH